MIDFSDNQLRLMARVARAYHEQGMRQVDIAEAFHVSQARVSRLLKAAVQAGIVRTSVTLPANLHTDLEEQLEDAYGLRQAIVVDVDRDVTPALGAAAAEYLSATLVGGDTVGISSWSTNLIATVSALTPFKTPVVDTVVQLVGGMGNPQVQMQATQLIGQFANRTGAAPLMLPTPGILGSSAARDTLMADPTVADVVDCWSRLTLTLVGIGALDPSDLARESGNVFPETDRVVLDEAGAVGDVCFRFYDAAGNLVDSTFDDRVIGIDPDMLRAVERRVGVAGGENKTAAIRGALLGRWVNILVTDRVTARRLVERR